MNKTIPIPIPKTIPNKLKQIRQIRGLTLQEAAKGLKIHPFFLSSVENGKNNLSGKSTMNVLHFFNVSFEQLYDMKKVLLLDYVEESRKQVIVEIVLDKSETYSSPLEIEQKILEELHEKDIGVQTGTQVYTYNIIETKETLKPGKILCKINVELILQKTLKKEFDINFFRDSNIKLVELLLEKGFSEQPYNIRLDKNDFKIIGDKIHLNKKYKIETDEGFTFIDEVDISETINSGNKKYVGLDGEIKVIRNESDEIIAMTFIALEEEINNIKFIEDYYEKYENFDNTKIPELLGLSASGYSNLVHGNQKISTKIMWRMVKLFRVPLETILNIKKYANKVYQIEIF